MKALLIAGLFFPGLSLLTAPVSAWQSWRYQRHVSPIFIPFVGPILLTCWIILDQRPLWAIPIVWLLDIGTLMFLLVTPRLIRDWWQTSSFTRRLKLQGSVGIEAATLTFHTGGRYLLEKCWNRPPETNGIIGLGEIGTYVEINSGYELTAHHGLRRVLRSIDNQTPERSFSVSEDSPSKENANSLEGWVLKVVP